MINIIVFVDWDNTLLPTYALQNDKYYFKNGNLSNITLLQLQNLEEIILKFFDTICNICNKSDLFIITNAESSWVNFSAKIYLPIFYDKFLKLNEQNLISAQDLHSDEYPDDIEKWKYQVFKTIIDNFIEKNKITNVKLSVISIADGDLEYNIMEKIINKKNNILVKKIKLTKQSSIINLIKQIDILNKNFVEIVNKEENLNIKLVIKNDKKKN